MCVCVICLISHACVCMYTNAHCASARGLIGGFVYGRLFRALRDFSVAFQASNPSAGLSLWVYIAVYRLLRGRGFQCRKLGAAGHSCGALLGGLRVLFGHSGTLLRRFISLPGGKASDAGLGRCLWFRADLVRNWLELMQNAVP